MSPSLDVYIPVCVGGGDSRIPLFVPFLTRGTWFPLSTYSMANTVSDCWYTSPPEVTGVKHSSSHASRVAGKLVQAQEAARICLHAFGTSVL